MYQCPVCNAASETTLCSRCGFDISRDYGSYPTLGWLPESARSVCRRQVQPGGQQQTDFRCPACGASSFMIDAFTYDIRCGSCGQPQGMAQLIQPPMADLLMETKKSPSFEREPDRYTEAQGDQNDDMVDVTARFAGKRVTIRSVQNGCYLCADSTLLNTPLTANRSAPLAWEVFTLSPITEDGWLGIRAHNGKYLTVKLNMPNAPLQAQKGFVQYAERFRIFRMQGVYYLMARVNNNWLSARINDSQVPVQACAEQASDWERFEINIIGA